jgi:hypothetical protein
MLEYWNIGKMGFGILKCWVNGKNRLDDKIKTDNILKKPLFHHSHYSMGEAKLRPQNLFYIFII